MPPRQLGTSLEAQVASLRADVNKLLFKLDQSKQVPPVADTSPQEPLTFSYPGAVASGVPSPRWYADEPRAFSRARLSADTSGGGDLSVDVNVDGSTIITLTLGSGENTVEFAAVFIVGAGSYVSVATTAVAGQEEVSVELYR